MRQPRRDDHGAGEVQPADPLRRPAQSSGGADQDHDRCDAAPPPAPIAAIRPIELAVEKADRTPGKHDRVRDMSEHRRHIAEYRVDHHGRE